MVDHSREKSKSSSNKFLSYLEKTGPGSWVGRQWQRHPVRLVGVLLFLGAAVFFFLNYLPGKFFEEFSANIATDLASIALAVFIIDVLVRRRLDDQLKKQLILQMGSKRNDITYTAIRALRAFSWGFTNDRTLQDANFVKANLREADLPQANLQRARLDLADLQGANLDRADLQAAKLERANLQGASLHKVNLMGSRLDRANLQGANLKEADLEDAQLNKADLRGAHMFKVNLKGASLNEAYLQRAGLGGADLEEAQLSRADLQGASLATANLKKARLGEANLKEARLYRANLEEAVLYGADLRGAQLHEANLEGTVLYGANLRGARGLTLYQLKSVTTLSGTTMPDGSSPETLALRLFQEGRIDEQSSNTLIRLAGVGAKEDHSLQRVNGNIKIESKPIIR